MVNFRNVQQCSTCGGAKVDFIGNEGERELRMVNYCAFCLREAAHKEDMLVLNSKYTRASSWLSVVIGSVLLVTVGMGALILVLSRA